MLPNQNPEAEPYLWQSNCPRDCTTAKRMTLEAFLQLFFTLQVYIALPIDMAIFSVVQQKNTTCRNRAGLLLLFLGIFPIIPCISGCVKTNCFSRSTCLTVKLSSAPSFSKLCHRTRHILWWERCECWEFKYTTRRGELPIIMSCHGCISLYP